MKNPINYTADHFYFITLVTLQRWPYFGYIQHEQMQTNHYAVLARQSWFAHIDRYPYLYHHRFIIMPNHLHAIVEYRQDPTAPCFDRISLPKWIAQFKSQSTVYIRRAGLVNFKWQSGFYDHVIRDHQSFLQLSNYIANNPTSWQNDKLYCHISKR